MERRRALQLLQPAAHHRETDDVGPIAQAVFIPFMTTGRGVELIGPWFGTGAGRGIALVFIASGFIGLAVTLLAMRSRAYVLLARRYEEGTAANPVPRA